MAGTRSVVLLDIGLALAFIVHVLVVIWVLRRGFRARARRSRVGEEHAEEEGGGAAAGLSAEEVAGLPCHEFKEEGAAAAAAAAADECAVCLEAFRAGDRRRVLPRCGHGFHAACVDSWLRKSRRCPVCRAEVAAQAQRKDARVVAEGAATTLQIVTPR